MSVVDEIKQRIDIVDLVSQYVTLKRAGRAYNALCPFHSEKTPSFHVDPQRQTWHCFGACSTGGDIFSFVMKRESCDFREALRLLGERAGVNTAQRRDTQEDARRARLYEMNEAAAAFFQASLQREGGAQGAKAQVARDYLAERRMAPESVERFQIGYAPNSWDALLEHMTGRGFAAEELVAAGLAVEGERGAYDRFRHRLMFPIRDERARVCGFGGRVLAGDALGSGDGHQPKYVNTSQSAIFDKGSMLYALDLAKDAIRSEGRAVIVEGYMDVIAAHEHGYANVVASMGTALTERQVALVERHHPRQLILALDPDGAGVEATIRSAYDIIQKRRKTAVIAGARGVRASDVSGVDLRILSLPDGRDPDELIRESAARWADLVSESRPVVDHFLELASNRFDLRSLEGRSEAVTWLAPYIALTADRVVQANYIQQLARLTQTDERTLALEIRARGATRPRPPRERSTESPATRAAPARVRDKREEFCLALLFKYPELRAEAYELSPELFGHSENRSLFESWVSWADDGETFESTLTPDVRPQYERILSIDIPTFDDEQLAQALRSTVWGIEQQRLRTAKRASAAALAGMSAEEGARIAEDARARIADDVTADPAEDEADPAAVFVEDMEAGLRVHRRLLDQRSAGRSRGEVVHEQ